MNLSSIFLKETSVIGKKLSSLVKGRKPASLYEPCDYILQSDGKKLRPFLVIAFSQLFNKSNKKPYNAAIAVELLHNFSLVHDDIMDNSDTRRGRITLHKKYDLSVAILTGDNLLGLAYDYLLKDCVGDRGIEAARYFTKGVIEICEGQSLDKEFETKKNVLLDEYFEMISKKTAALLKMCCQVGACLGLAEKKEISAAAKYGFYLGIAFQIVDDLLDVIGNEKEVGKPLGSDLVEGKKTFLLIKALELSSRQEKKKIIELIKNNGIDKSQVDDYRKIYEKVGAIAIAQEEALKYTQLAIKQIKKVPNNLYKDSLVELAMKLASRTK